MTTPGGRCNLQAGFIQSFGFIFNSAPQKYVANMYNYVIQPSAYHTRHYVKGL